MESHGGQGDFGRFSQALKSFRDTLTFEEVERFAKTDLLDLKVTMKAIQNRHRADHRMQDMRRLELFLQIVDSYHEFLSEYDYEETQDLATFIWVSHGTHRTKR